MRKITAGLFIALDGVVEAPDQWHFPYFNEEMGAAVNATFGAADTMFFGRKTYDSFAGAWPEREAAGGEDAGLAKALGDARKIVVSNQKLEFTHAAVRRGRDPDPAEADLVRDLRDGRPEPRLRTGRVDRRRHLRGCQGSLASVRAVGLPLRVSRHTAAGVGPAPTAARAWSRSRS